MTPRLYISDTKIYGRELYPPNHEDTKMRAIRYNFLFVIGLMMTLGLTTAFANGGDDKNKAPKNMGTLSIKTTPVSYPIKVDGQYIGMSGVGTGAEFYLTPGFHTVEVAGPNGTSFTKEIEIKREQKHCVCLRLNEIVTSKACPYRFSLDGPDRISEGDTVTFAAINSGTAPIPIKYAWRVANGRIESGLGTSSITVNSKGLGGKTIDVELDVNDDVYDNRCRQVISVPTFVEPIKEPPPITKVGCDQFEAKSADDDKARFDNCAIQVQNTPDAKLYVIIYPGTDRVSTTRNTYDRLSRRTLDYLVKTRGVDPRNIQILKGSPRTRTAYEIWIVPAGAEPPVVQ